MTSATTPRLDTALLLLRVAPALMLIGFHGGQKLLSAGKFLFAGEEWAFVAGVAGLGFPLPAFFAVCAALAESVVAAVLALGFFTRYAAAILSFNMAVATYRHLTTDLRFELAAIYLLIFLVFVIVPPGRYSLDALRQK
jgi:putative oxidoreductase